jgi:hypothetical protein
VEINNCRPFPATNPLILFNWVGDSIDGIAELLKQCGMHSLEYLLVAEDDFQKSKIIYFFEVL